VRINCDSIAPCAALNSFSSLIRQVSLLSKMHFLSSMKDFRNYVAIFRYILVFMLARERERLYIGSLSIVKSVKSALSNTELSNIEDTWFVMVLNVFALDYIHVADDCTYQCPR